MLRRFWLQTVLLMAVLQPLSWEVAATAQDEGPPRPMVLSVGVENIRHYPYYGMCGREFCGFARDLLDSFAADRGLDLRYMPLPINRLHRAMLDGRIDLKFPASPIWATTEKAGYEIFYSKPVIDFVDGIMSLAGADAAPARIGTIRGFTLNQDLLDRAGVERVIEAGTDQDLIQLLLRGRVDGIYSNIAVINHALRQQKLDDGAFVFRSDLPYQRSSYYLSSRQRHLTDSFDAWMAERADTVAALKARYELGASSILSSTAR